LTTMHCFERYCPAGFHHIQPNMLYSSYSTQEL
jgi:hypothetical protein